MPFRSGPRERAFSGTRYLVETATWPSLFSSDSRVLPPVRQQARSFEARECLVERAVCRKPSRSLVLLDLARDGEAVELFLASASEVETGLQDLELEGEERTGLTTHEEIIGRYLLLSQGRRLNQADAKTEDPLRSSAPVQLTTT